MISFFRYFFIALFSCILSWIITEIFRRWANRKRWLDIPNDRSSHSSPTPRGGGIGIVGAMILGWLLLIFVVPEQATSIVSSAAQAELILTGIFLIIAISGMDDYFNGISPGIRLFTHMISAGLVVIAFGGWNRIDFPFIGEIGFGFAGIPLALFWIVGLVNAYNFMDGIDGIAGVQGVTAAAGWIAIGIISKNGVVTIFVFLLSGAIIGFLFHNWPPAKIFLGDIGSAFLGFIFAIIPFLTIRRFPDPISARIPIAGMLLVAPFILDASFTLARRILRRERISQAHRSHLYQRLVLSGLSHHRVALIYFGIGFIGSLAGVGNIFIENRHVAGILVMCALLIIFIVPLSLVHIRENRLK